MRGRFGWVVAAIAATCVGAFSAAAPLALGAGGNAVINDCESNGTLTHQYTVAQLKQAIQVMPASDKQYGNCYDVIENAIAHHGRTGKAGPGSGGSFLPTPVIVILVVLILAAVTFGAIAIRRRRGGGGPGGPAGGPDDGAGGQSA
jgi:hypothetical protein